MTTTRSAGRPEVGRPVNIRLGDDLLAQLDDFAAGREWSRAEAARFLISVALSERHGAP
mgnify:CR=1 FL=1